MRNLASIQRVTNIRPIEGKDRIVQCNVLGWNLIIKKDEFEEGCKCVYCEIDSVLPDKPEFEFLRKNNFRVRTMKMAGVRSEGICFPLTILPAREKPYEIGEDVTDLMGITKWEPQEEETWWKDLKQEQSKKTFWEKLPLMRFRWYRRIFGKSKKAKRGWPEQIPCTDEQRIQNCPWVLDDKETKWLASEKLDGCLVASTDIKTDQGDIKIGQIVNHKMPVNVLSYNEELGICEFKPVIDWHKIPNTRPHYKIGVAFRGHGCRPKFIECTDNHKFLTKRGWLRADELKIDDVLMHYSKIYPNELDEVLLGCVLGDSSLNSNSGTGGYRSIFFAHGDKQAEYFEYKKKLFGHLFIEQRDHISGYGSLIHTGCIAANLQTYAFIMKYFDKTGKKFVSETLANDLTPIALAFWFMDDGCLKNREDERLRCRAMMNTQRYSLEENQILADALKRKFNIEVTIGDKETYKGYVLQFDADNTDKLCTLIAPYVCASMKYKLPKKYELMPCVFEDFTMDYCDSVVETAILSIECIGTTSDQFVYDLEVADNHNYFAKNTLVHNCSASYLLLRHRHRIRPDTFEFVVCSRKLRLARDNSHYWFVADKYHIEEVLRGLIGKMDWVAIQGEILGPKIQKNKYGFAEHCFYPFNLLAPDPATGKCHRMDSVTAAVVLKNRGMNFVPIIETEITLPDTVDEVLAMAHGQSRLGDTLREGLVFRSMDGQKSFKSVDPEFLIHYGL